MHTLMELASCKLASGGQKWCDYYLIQVGKLADGKNKKLKT